jgi:hypothetical protein
MNPSLDKDPAPGVQGVNPQGGLLPGLEGEAAPGLRGRETPQKGGENALPIKEGWGSRIVRAVDRGSVVAWKAFEWGLTIFIGLSWLFFALLAMALG